MVVWFGLPDFAEDPQGNHFLERCLLNICTPQFLSFRIVVLYSFVRTARLVTFEPSFEGHGSAPNGITLKRAPSDRNLSVAIHGPGIIPRFNDQSGLFRG